MRAAHCPQYRQGGVGKPLVFGGWPTNLAVGGLLRLTP